MGVSAFFLGEACDVECVRKTNVSMVWWRVLYFAVHQLLRHEQLYTSRCRPLPSIPLSSMPLDTYTAHARQTCTLIFSPLRPQGSQLLLQFERAH